MNEFNLADYVVNELGGNELLTKYGAKEFYISEDVFEFRVPLAHTNGNVHTIQFTKDWNETNIINVASIDKRGENICSMLVDTSVPNTPTYIKDIIDSMLCK